MLASAALACASALSVRAGGSEVPAPRPAIPAGAWSGALAEHPRLLGPRAHLASLAKAKPQAYREIRASSSIFAAGIVRAVEGPSAAKAGPFVDSAMKAVARGVTNLHQDTWLALTEVALAYDLFFDEIPPADRSRMIDWMNAHLERYTEDENAFHNSTLSKILCYLRISYGTWGENPRAREFRERALSGLYEGKVLPVLLEFGDGGGFTECGWYARGSLWNLAEGLELARRFDGYDGFAKAARFFYDRLSYELHQSYPGLWLYGSQRYPVEGDGAACYGGHNEYPRHLRTILAQYFRGSERARAVAAFRRRGSNPESRLVDFLYEEEPDAPLAPGSLPLSHFARGIGRVYARSGWTDDATWLRFECGDYWNHHQHFETGNFEIFRHEPLAAESGEYHDYASSHAVNWLIRTVAHNCILVYDPSEKWGMLRDGGRNPYANDGGQAKKWDWTVDTLDEWTKRRDSFERGDIVAFEDAGEFLHVAADCTRAYSRQKLALWVRQLVFLRPHTVLVFDRVVSTRPELEKTWLLHSRNEPELAPPRTSGKGGGPSHLAAVANGKGRLLVATLLPSPAEVGKVEGYAYRGRAFEPPKTVHSEYANRWRLEVRPTRPAAEDIFLHVLWTGEGPSRDRPDPRELEPPAGVELLRRGRLVGARAGGAEVLFDGAGSGEVTVGGKRRRLGAIAPVRGQ